MPAMAAQEESPIKSRRCMRELYPENVLTDLVQIRRLGEKNRDENLRFRRWIKSHNFVERQFRRAAEEVQDAIDCRQCGECCRVTEVQIVERDVERLARYLGLNEQQFIAEY